MAQETMSDEAAALFAQGAREPLLPDAGRGGEAILDRAGVEAILPHRDPFLLVDRVLQLDEDQGTIVARYSLARAGEVFAGHFPGFPVWPGVLQVEAIAQAGAIVALRQRGEAGAANVTLTHILNARFVRPIPPGGEVELAARVLDDGFFFTIVGQCLVDGAVCSVAAVKGF